jgi:hypothetical protein
MMREPMVFSRIAWAAGVYLALTFSFLSAQTQPAQPSAQTQPAANSIKIEKASDT